MTDWNPEWKKPRKSYTESQAQICQWIEPRESTEARSEETLRLRGNN